MQKELVFFNILTDQLFIFIVKIDVLSSHDYFM